MLWRQGEPPVLLFAAMMQWLQAAAGIYHYHFYGGGLADDLDIPEVAKATWLSLVGVIFSAVGMRIAMLRAGALDRKKLKEEELSLSPVRLLMIYGGLSGISILVRIVAYRVPGLTQPLMAATSIQWVAVIMLIQAVLAQRRNYLILVGVVIFEFAVGLMGFFGNFKNIIFILGVLLLTHTGSLSIRRWIAVAIMVIFLATVSCVWQGVRDEYREFLNRGTGEQVVLEPISARVEKLSQLLHDLDRAKMAYGLEQSLLRSSYVSLFARCIVNVPQHIPYENGALWIGAVKHTFMPRLFFPDKPEPDDSERARKYTGRDFAGKEEGTSIGIGYMAESYIDFGPYYMFIPVLLLGIFSGLIYRLFIFHRRYRLLGIASAMTVLAFGANTIETSNIKIIGGNTVNFLALGLIYWAFGSAFMRFAIRKDLRLALANKAKHGHKKEASSNRFRE